MQLILKALVLNLCSVQLDMPMLQPTLEEISKLHIQESLNFEFAENPFDCGCDSLQKMQVHLTVFPVSFVSYVGCFENSKLFGRQHFIFEYKVLLRDSDYLACGKDRVQNTLLAFFWPSVDYIYLFQVVSVRHQGRLRSLVSPPRCGRHGHHCRHRVRPHRDRRGQASVGHQVKDKNHSK